MESFNSNDTRSSAAAPPAGRGEDNDRDLGSALRLRTNVRATMMRRDVRRIM